MLKMYFILSVKLPSSAYVSINIPSCSSNSFIHLVSAVFYAQQLKLSFVAVLLPMCPCHNINIRVMTGIFRTSALAVLLIKHLPYMERG